MSMSGVESVAGVAVPPSRRLRSIFGGAIGNLVEWYDWLAFSTFSLYFAHAFFPEGNQTAQLMSTAAVFAVGYVMRPLGAVLFGWYADRKGRRAALTLSVYMMCGGSLLVATHAGFRDHRDRRAGAAGAGAHVSGIECGR